MDIGRIQEIIRLFEASELCEIEVEEEGLRVLLKKPQPNTFVAHPGSLAMPAHPQGMPLALTGTEALPPQEEKQEEIPTIDSPMVGTFYRSRAPGEPSFVSVGDTVEENQPVCIVEAMKLMNEVTARFPCVIVESLVENSEPVEFGQPLFAIRPL